MASETPTTPRALTAQDLLTARQMAEKLGVSEHTVTRWARLNLIPWVKLPGKRGHYRFAQHTVDQLLAGIQPGDDFEQAS